MWLFPQLVVWWLIRHWRADHSERDVASKVCRASLRIFSSKYCQETSGEQILKLYSKGSCLDQLKKNPKIYTIGLKADWGVYRKVSVLLKALRD